MLNYKPQSTATDDAAADTFRQKLMSGNAEIIHPILLWLLQRREDSKKRVYLARFLVKVDIPPEMRTDSDVSDLYEQVNKSIFEAGKFKIFI